MKFHAGRAAAFFAILSCAGRIEPCFRAGPQRTNLGTVTDQSGAVVPGVKITITETRTNSVRTTETNDAGNYFLVNLDPGDFRVEAEKAGFSQALRSGVELQPNTTVRVNFELTAGAVTQTIDVTANGDAAPNRPRRHRRQDRAEAASANAAARTTATTPDCWSSCPAWAGRRGSIPSSTTRRTVSPCA